MKKIKTFIMLCVILCLMLTTVGVSAATYTDTNHWAKNYVDYVTEQGYFVGTSSTTFSPDANMTRAMFVTVLARYDGVDLSTYNIQPFTDIVQNSYYTQAVLWAYDKKIVSGTSSTTFSPNNYITREEVAVMINNYLSYKNNTSVGICSENDETIYFNDINSVSSWALNAVKNMKNLKIFTGNENNNFNPQSNLTRAECTVISSRLNNKNFDIYVPIKEEVAQTVSYSSGSASAYSFSLIGHITANGEYLSSTAYTVAVPISEYKTYRNRHVEIVYNGITITAKCNDCGGFAKYGRVLDLSPGVIKAFGFTSANSWGVRNIQYRWID